MQMDLVEFTHAKDGMETEYQKALNYELELIRINRFRKTLNERYAELHKRQDRCFEYMQNLLIELSLTERALHEINENWDNKEYWGEELK